MTMPKSSRRRRFGWTERLELRRMLAPVAEGDSYTIDAQTPAELMVLENDFDTEGWELFLAELTPATLGNVRISDAGDAVIYTPTGATGTDTFTYTLGNENFEFVPGYVTVVIERNSNNQPNAEDDSVTADSDPYEFDVLGNDTDPDGDPLDILTAGPAQHGSVIVNNNRISYSGQPGFTGTDEFTYSITDGRGGTDTATIVVVVENSVAASADSATTAPEETVVIDVLNNDVGNGVTITSVAQPANGTAEFQDAISYTPNSGFLGTDQFTYTIHDENGVSAVGTVTVIVAPTESMEVRGITINGTDAGSLTDPEDLSPGPQPSSWALQRSDLRLVTVEFSEPVLPRPGDFRLRNLGVDSPNEDDQGVDLSDSQLVSITADGQIVHLAFEPYALADGVYELEILTSLRGDSGRRLPMPHRLTGDANNRFYKLAGDWNGDLSVTVFDVSTLAYWFGQTTAVAPEYVDCSTDDGVTIFDFPCLALNFSKRVEFTPAARPAVLPQPRAHADLISPASQNSAAEIGHVIETVVNDWSQLHERRIHQNERQTTFTPNETADAVDALLADWMSEWFAPFE